MKKVLIIGATSAIAEATARLWANAGHQLYLLARDEQKLITIAQDLKIRGAAQVDYAAADFDQTMKHAKLIQQSLSSLHTFDYVLIAHGYLPAAHISDHNIPLALASFHTNAVSTLSFIHFIIQQFKQQKYGTLAVITSVAGDRGRQSNPIYAAAKAAVSVFLQGLQHQFYRSNIHIIDIKPGFVDTPMTAEFKKGLLWAQPETIGQGIAQVFQQPKNCIYLPQFWRYIMLIIRWLPDFILHRTKL